MKDKEKEKGMLEDEGKLLEQLKSYYDIAINWYGPIHRKIRLLDAIDRGDLWKALRAKFPAYQILPDSNHVSYVKNNILASIYTVAKSAQIIPTSEDDKEIVTQLNVAMEQIWDLCGVGFKQFEAGERAALLNYGITQIGWDESVITKSKDFTMKGNCSFTNVDPIKFMRDPFAQDLDSAGHCMKYDSYHKSTFLSNKDYKAKFLEYLKTQKEEAATSQDLPRLDVEKPKGGAKDYYNLIIFWVRDGDKVHEIHTIDCQKVLMKKENIQPSTFPFAELYCNLAAGSLIGTSEPAKILANSIAYNLMDSIALTAEYKNQHPPKFISSGSGLNIQSFAKYGDQADKTFVVNGRAQDAIHYHQFPQISPGLSALKIDLEKNIETVSGVDGRYTGRDTGSIITTGGTEEMLNRVTLIDTPKIMNYEEYTKRLTKLVLANFIEHSPKRKYFYQKKGTTKWETLEVDFPKIETETLFNYALHISSELPKNKQRLAATANMLMEKQMQYQKDGADIELLTHEEWLMMQDLPNKEAMLERMGIQRMSNAVEEVSQVLFEYADLVRNGLQPDDALLATAEGLKQKRMGGMPQQGIPGAMPEEQGMPPMGGSGGPGGMMGGPGPMDGMGMI